MRDDVFVMIMNLCVEKGWPLSSISSEACSAILSEYAPSIISHCLQIFAKQQISNDVWCLEYEKVARFWCKYKFIEAVEKVKNAKLEDQVCLCCKVNNLLAHQSQGFTRLYQ